MVPVQCGLITVDPGQIKRSALYLVGKFIKHFYIRKVVHLTSAIETTNPFPMLLLPARLYLKCVDLAIV
jgi:hypothetical protein